MKEIGNLLEKLAKNEGYTSTYIDGISVFKTSKSSEREPLKYESRIIIVGEGRKIGYLDGRKIEYNKENYLILSIPMAFECEAKVEEGKEFLGLIIDIDLNLLNEVISSVDLDDNPNNSDFKSGVDSVFLDEKMKESTIRLIEALFDEQDSKILGKNLLKELYYRALKGIHGPSLLSLYDEKTRFGKLSKILQDINTNYDKVFVIPDLAKQMGMSEATFFRYFKSVTGNTPIQYIKNIRLHKAKDLIINEKMLLKEASKLVGYNSVSQFSREFKRYFNTSPKQI